MQRKVHSLRVKAENVRLSVRPLYCTASSTAAATSVHATEQSLTVTELACHPGNIHVNPLSAPALAVSAGEPGAGQGPSHNLPPGVRHTQRTAPVEVIQAGERAAKTKTVDGLSDASAVRHYALPVLECDVVACRRTPEQGEGGSDSGAPSSLSSLSTKVVVWGEDDAGRSSSLRTIHFLDLTSLSTQDNTLLRHRASGEVLPPCTLLCRTRTHPLANPNTRTAATPPGSRRPPAVFYKRRRVIILDDDDIAAEPVGKTTFELVSYGLKRRAA